MPYHISLNGSAGGCFSALPLSCGISPLTCTIFDPNIFLIFSKSNFFHISTTLLATVSYTYDNLDRVKSINYSGTNTYDVDGIRDSKTVGGVKHTYTALSGKIIRESYGTTTVDYVYDNKGNPYKMILYLNGTTYAGYFAVNQQGM